MKFLNLLNTLVFLLATVVVMSIFYEGVTLQWYNFVPILVLTTDIAFILATIINLIFNRKVKIVFWFNIFSIVLIGIAIIIKIAAIPYPLWGLVLWNFYILFFYGIQVFAIVSRKTGRQGGRLGSKGQNA